MRDFRHIKDVRQGYLDCQTSFRGWLDEAPLRVELMELRLVGDDHLSQMTGLRMVLLVLPLKVWAYLVPRYQALHSRAWVV